MPLNKAGHSPAGGGADRPSAGAPGPVCVGIGASAGALGALERFFALLPPDTGLVFIVVQHLERRHPSVLAEILGKHTRMPVRQADDHERIHPSHVYIIPPDAELTLARGELRVARSTEPGLRTPIDVFFRSLAGDQGERAIAVVLSGAGSDGTAGLRAIKDQGGTTFAQSPETARYDSMPQSAIAAGLVDFIASIDEMPEQILAVARRLGDVQRETIEQLDAQVTAELGAISALLQRQTGHDFSRYKPGTLVRRIRRRIQLQQMSGVRDYVQLLEREPTEVERLHRDLLIGVTWFFRDPETFELVAAEVCQRIVEGSSSSPARIWVPGCASGEEAYSLAILMREHLSRVGAARPVQIFATDIDSELLATARQGRYPSSIAEQVSPERLQRFFVREGDSYRVSKEIRELCTFSEHSLIRDPPFSSLDLISCRNVLIYLGAELQQKLVPLFHYALRPGGFLLLGPSESLAVHSELFTIVDKKHRLFQRNEAVVRPPLEFPLAGRKVPREAAPPRVAGAEPVPPQIFSQAFERMMLDEYAPPAAVTNGQGDILYLAGRAGRYLQMATGVPTNNLFDLAHGALRIELRNVLTKAVTTRRRVIRSNVPSEMDGGTELLRLTARPLPGVDPESGLYAVVLQSMGGAAEHGGDDETFGAPDQPIIEQLENELRTTRSNLQSAMQDVDSSNEALKSANEELISTNEELRSANEELQTSTEELQAANDELRTKVVELDAANSDLQYHFAGTDIITVFLDRELRVLRCTPAASKLFKVLDGDAGRPFADIAPRFIEENVMPDLETVLRSGTLVERHVRHPPSAFLVRILPYRAQDRSITGVGITFVDVTTLIRAEEAERRYGRLLLLSPDAIVVWRLDGSGVESWNRAAQELYGHTAEEARGKDPRELLGETYPDAWSKIEKKLRETSRWVGEVSSRTKDGRKVTVSASLALMRAEDGVDRILQTDRDITDRKAAEVERERLIEALKDEERRKSDFLAMLSHELRNPLTPVRNSLFILDRAAPGGEQAQRAKAVIERQVGQLTRIVEDLLEVTRISRGKLQLQKTRVELGGLVRRTVEDHRSLLANSGLALEVRVANEQLWVDGDPDRLAQAVGNLLANAAKFTERGGHVRVELEKDRAGRMAVIRVRDDGAGINPDVLAHVFEPFTQADRTLDRSRGGLGLGLSLAKGLVDQHGGELRARSEGAGMGAEFTILVPLVDPPPAERSAPAPRGTRAPLRILVIEDHFDAADSLREALQHEGHVVEVAHDGPEGVQKARQFKPDVIVCDIGLPKMDGYAVAQAIRGDEELRTVRMVALTGYALPEDLAKARDAGFDVHLAKPPSIDKLDEVLRTLFA